MSEDIPLTSEDFTKFMDRLSVDWPSVDAIAVGVSGGPDLMALCRMLSEWTQARGIEVHALSVDHGLRKEAAAEAAQVGHWLQGLAHVCHHVLKWEAPSETAVQEEARKARYALMAAYCEDRGIEYLFLGHHRDDQAETLLFRLAKGSGLDGLAGMQAVQPYEGIDLVRPLLDVPKAALVEYCQQAGVDYCEDPSNESEKYARVRLRKARAVLEEEGLTAKRLSLTAMRLARARKALEILADEAYKEVVLKNDSKRIELNLKSLLSKPEEVMLRCVLKAIWHLKPDLEYGPRMEKVESILYDLRNAENFRKRTLSGLVFECDDAKEILVIMPE